MIPNALLEKNPDDDLYQLRFHTTVIYRFSNDVSFLRDADTDNNFAYYGRVNDSDGVDKVTQRGTLIKICEETSLGRTRTILLKDGRIFIKEELIDNMAYLNALPEMIAEAKNVWNEIEQESAVLEPESKPTFLRKFLNRYFNLT